MSVSSRDVASGYAHAADHYAVTLDEAAFRARLTDCYDCLAGVAASGGTITYAELAEEVGLDGREALDPLLDAIAYIEARAGRPPLSVLAVNSRTGKPGVAFFDSVDRLGVDDGYRAHTDDELVAMMATNVYAAWQK